MCPKKGLVRECKEGGGNRTHNSMTDPQTWVLKGHGKADVKNSERNYRLEL